MPVGIGAGMKFRNPLRPNTRKVRPSRMREIRTIVFIVRLSSKAYSRRVGFGLSRPRTVTGPMGMGGMGSMGVGSVDGEGEDFAALEPEPVVERDRTAGKLPGDCDRKADVVSVHRRAYHGERRAVFATGL